MSAASRLQAADTCFVPAGSSETWPSLTRNSAAIPGGRGFDLDESFVWAGVTWIPTDSGPFAMPIGAMLALELATEPTTDA